MKLNTNLVEDITQLSQLDPGGVIKDVHDFPGHSLRTRDAVSVVSTHYTHFDVSYDVDANPTKVTYYAGTSPHVTTIGFASDIAGSLNNKYFYLYEGRNRRLFHVWYNVDGTGTDPNPGGSTGIEINISQGDPAAIVAYATELVLSGLYSTEFYVRRINATLTISASQYGITSDTVDVNTAFLINNTQGTQQETQVINIEYVNGNPIYESKELKGYRYNIYTGKFEFSSIDIGFANVALSRHEEYRNLTFESTKLDTELSVVTYTNILNYTATENLKLKIIKVKADTFGVFRIKIDGVVKDYYRTSQLERNCLFAFSEDEDLPNLADIDIEFIPDRIQQVSTYNFFIRIEAYV